MPSTAATPVIVETTRGEVGVFVDQPETAWSVVRPVREGWQLVGMVRRTPDGYRPTMDAELPAVASVVDAAQALAERAATVDLADGLPGPLAFVPEDEPGVFGHLAGLVGDALEAATRAPAGVTL